MREPENEDHTNDSEADREIKNVVSDAMAAIVCRLGWHSCTIIDEETGPELLLEEGFEEGFYVAGYLLVALGGGVGVVGLHVAWDAVDVFEEEGDEGNVVSLGEGGVHGVELFDVVGAVAGGKGDASEGDGDVAGLELSEDGGEVGLGLLDGEAAEAVVAAEFHDDDLGVAGDYAGDAVEAVLGGVAADAGVDYVVVVAFGVEEALEVVGVGLAEVGAIAGGEGVAETDEEGARVGRWCGGGSELCGVGLRRVNKDGVRMDYGRGRFRFAAGEGEAEQYNR